MNETSYPLLVSNNDIYFLPFEKILPFSNTTFSISQQIIEYIGNNPELPIFLDIETRSETGYRQSHPLLEVLIYLRCHYLFRNPVICLGFEPLSQILSRHPEHLILCSPGTCYLQFPLSKKSFLPSDLPASIGNEEFVGLKKFVQGIFNLERYRHQEANQWGIEIQWKVHSSFNPDFTTALPPLIEQKNKELNQVVAKFLFMKPGETAPANLPDIQQIRKKLLDNPPAILHIDDQSKDGWSDLFQHIIYGKITPEHFHVLDIDPLDDIDSIIKKMEAEINNNSFNAALILLDVRLIPAKDEHEKEIKKLSGPTVLQFIRKKYLGLPVIITTASNKARTYQELMALGADAYWMKEGLDDHYAPEESFGSYHRLLHLLSTLLNEEYGLLKLMADTFQKIQSGPAWWEDKTWTMSGINRSKRLREAYAGNLKTRTLVDQKELFGIYSDGIGLYRYFLSRKLLQASFRLAFENDWFYYSSIIVHFGKALELIHEVTQDEYRLGRGFSPIMEWRNDEMGQNLYRDRNKAAHSGEARQIGFAQFQKFITDINFYLLNDQAGNLG